VTALAFLKAHWPALAVALAVLVALGILERLVKRPAETKTAQVQERVVEHVVTQVVEKPVDRVITLTRTVYRDRQAPDAGPCAVAEVTTTSTTEHTGGSTTVTKTEDTDTATSTTKDARAGSDAPRWTVVGLAGLSTTSGSPLYGAEVLWRPVGPLVVGGGVLAGPSQGMVFIGVGLQF
jgi:hypothetical protein